MKRWPLLLLLAALGPAVGQGPNGTWDGRFGPGGRRLMAPGDTFVMPGGRGSWEDGGGTGIPMLFANLMKDGRIVGWAQTYMGNGEGALRTAKYGSMIYDPAKKKHVTLFPGCGIHDCKNAFCAVEKHVPGHVTTWDNNVLIFGGHGDARDLEAFRSYSATTGGLYSKPMPSGRWYPTPCTLDDGRVLIVGGVKRNGQSGYFKGVDPTPQGRAQYDNPTYNVYTPWTRQFSPDRNEMRKQLEHAWPIHSYPLVVMTPDGGVAVAAGKSLVKYARSGATTFRKSWDWPDRPSAPWNYPQTGIGTVLPMRPPYDRMFLLVTGGSLKDKAKAITPNDPKSLYNDPQRTASNLAHVIELTDRNAGWKSVGPMPYKRVLGDGVLGCDGAVYFVGGGEGGIAGWSPTKTTYKYKSGKTYKCEKKCTDVWPPIYEPSAFVPGDNPVTDGKWSRKGSLAPMNWMRLYHSTAILLPDCRIWSAGSDVTGYQPTEMFSPPYLKLGPRPVITKAPDRLVPGRPLVVDYTSLAPVTKALLLRTGVSTHSQQFDQRAFWLEPEPGTGGFTGSRVTLATPPNHRLLPPGMYMLTLLTDRGAPSVARILSVAP